MRQIPDIPLGESLSFTAETLSNRICSLYAYPSIGGFYRCCDLIIIRGRALPLGVSGRYRKASGVFAATAMLFERFQLSSG